MSARIHTLDVRTPEGIAFSLPLASPVTRFLAWFVDIMCVMGAMIIINLVFGFFSLISADFANAIMALAFFVIQIGYAIAMEWFWRGQTLGKRALRLRVMDAQGMKLQFSQIVIRNLLRPVDALPLLYLTGGLACLISRKAQRLGDFAANTVVVRQPKLKQPNLDQLLAGKFNSLRQHAHLEARLRQRVSAAEAGAALQALLRRDDLDPKARVELFTAMAGHFREIVPFPDEITEGIPDEQYVRNVVDIVFRPRATGEKPRRTEPTDLRAPEEMPASL